MVQVATVDWTEARAALGQAAARFTAQLRTVERPDAPALGRWNVAELATHVSHAFSVVPGLAGRTRESPLGGLWDLSAMTTDLVADDAERDLAVLADRIDAGAARFLEATAGAAGDDPCPWLVQGTALPLVTLTCHLLNEAVIHGYDIAAATGQSWPIDPAHAALIFQGFLLEVFQVVDPRTFVVQERAAGLHACFDVRLRGAGRFFLVFADGAMTVEAPSNRRVDCHLSADPSAFLLVAWARTSQWRAIPKGQLVAWGRRPWLGLRFRGLLRNP
ncbi:MAG: maleylpyruvate isomerase N-terminal domain-containing protein [Acidimicrobiales bacterium]